MGIKVGILSMQRIANYGSFLQAYGLRSMLEELGHQVEFVDYHPGQCLIPSDGGSGLSRKIRKTLEVLSYKASLKEKLRFILYKKNYALNYYSYLGISVDKMNYAPELDMLIIGSDEVFNCVQDNTNVGFSPELFGAENKAKRVISYAASFGNTTWDKLQEYKVEQKVTQWLKKFDAISVRDSNSGEIIEKITGKKPIYNLDPVLVYDFVGKCAEIPDSVPESDYMILYGYSGRFTKEECKAIRSYAGKRNLRILCIGGIQHCCDKFIDCDPFQVIAYFKSAECVVTDTFHGTILSVITHQQFVTAVRTMGYGNHEKLTDLLKRLKLEKRLISNMDQIEQMLTEKVEYYDTDDVIRKGRVYAKEYLINQLEKANE